MSTYTTRFGILSVAAGATDLIYTAPSAVVSVIRDIIITNIGSGALVYNVSLRSGSLTVYIAASSSLGSSDSVHLDLRQVMAVGDQLFITSIGQPLTIAVTGYQLSTP